LDEKDLEPIELWMDGLVDDGGVSKCYMDTPKRGPSWDLKKLAPKAAKTRPTDWVIQRPEGYYCKPMILPFKPMILPHKPMILPFKPVILPSNR
jgi:hypothetical protein